MKRASEISGLEQSAKFAELPNSGAVHPPHYGEYLSAPSFWNPQYIENSAWLEHAPFAFWLTDVLKPRSIVELGTHAGFSYFAFCQAVQAMELETRCFAVDTWMGDEHAGFYGDDIFDGVNRYNNLHYSAFSSLVRSTFDEALQHFPDHSVDILHIDGRHHYEDVKHDFDSWVPKLSERAVVLFHDTNVRERGFGVFKFWAELAQRFPNFEFFHGHGLGILGYGTNLPPEIVSLCASSTLRDAAVVIRAAYSRLGGAVRAGLEARIATASLTNSANILSGLRKELDDRSTEIARLANEWNVLNDCNAALNGELEKLTFETVKLSNEWKILNDDNASLKRDLEDRASEVSKLESRLNVLTDENTMLNDCNAALISDNLSLKRDLEGRASEISKLESRLNVLANENTMLNDCNAALNSDNSSLVRDLEDRASEISNLESQLKALKDENAKLNNRGKLLEANLAVQGQQSAAVESQLTERDSQISKLNRTIAEDELKIQALVKDKERQIRLLRIELTKIRRSRSWRATAPLRRGTSWLRTWSHGKPLKAFFGTVCELLLRPDIRHIRASSLFDREYYLITYPDIQAAQVDPAIHYLIHGWKEYRDPSAGFNTARYLSANPDVAAAGINPLIHYLKYGRKEGRPLVSPEETTVGSFHAQSTSVASGAPATHSYSSCETSCATVDTILDLEKIDAEERAIRTSGLFDEAFYLSMYQDLQPKNLDPIRHYCERGWREGRNPSDEFDTEYYLKTYRDIHKAGINPFWHYVVAGAAEQRDASPDNSPRYENDVRFGTVDTDIKLLVFYASPDWAALRGGQPRFKGHLQPVLPTQELGHYDPIDGHILQRQAQMAKSHGIYGFCFDLDVTPGAMTETQPIGRLVVNSEIDIHFCVQICISPKCLIEPTADSLVRIFVDYRQIRIDKRPLLLVNIKEKWSGAWVFMSQLWKRLAAMDCESPFVVGSWAEAFGRDAGLEEFCDALLDLGSDLDPREIGKFEPNEKNGVGTVPYRYVASTSAKRIEARQNLGLPVYHVVTLGRDDTSRNHILPLVYTHFHVRDYRLWLDAAFASAKAAHQRDRRFVFVNAWNDWNRGLTLEPDSRMGFSCLNETTRALVNVETGRRMPKVSVIVPNYNHEPFLRRRLDSIYQQTYKNIEVVLLDDCSSDESRKILDTYAANHAETTRTLYNDRNSGSAFRQWAKGLRQATGELVWIAESDDFCDPRFLDVLVRCFDDEAVLLAYGNSVFVDRDEAPLPYQFESYLSDLECAQKWKGPYVETAHNEVKTALGIKNTIPNASGAVFRRPVDMALLEDESWLSMRVAGDWVFYLHILRGGKIAYRPDAISYFRRYQGSTAEVTYKTEIFYREVGLAARTVAALYAVPKSVLDRNRSGYESFYCKMIGEDRNRFGLWYDYEAVLQARNGRMPNVLVSTLGFSPGGAEILPIRLANEFKRQGHSVLLLNAGLMGRQDGVRRMLRNDVPVVETSDIEDMRNVIVRFGIEALNSHHWHIQKYPVQNPYVFDGLRTHVASLHGMIEHGDAFEVSREQLEKADRKVTAWVYTADKNLVPFSTFRLCDMSSGRFVKIPNGMQPPKVSPIPRTRMDIPEDAFVLCCVSRAIEDKGWLETIAAVECARGLSGRDIRLILVGNGPVYDEFCRVGTPNFVYLAGFSEHSVGHYAASDMGIMLTKFKSESFPLTILDCLFAGKPFVASDIGEIRNMLTVGNDVAGSVIELDHWEIPIARVAQEIAAFASDQQKYLDASAVVDAAARRYRIDEVASQYIELFEAGRRNPRLGEA